MTRNMRSISKHHTLMSEKERRQALARLAADLEQNHDRPGRGRSTTDDSSVPAADEVLLTERSQVSTNSLKGHDDEWSTHVWAWGCSVNGQCLDAAMCLPRPKRIHELATHSIGTSRAGDQTSSSDRGRRRLSSQPSRAACGRTVSAVVTQAGEVATWGSGLALGRDSGPKKGVVVEHLTGVVDLSIGEEHGLACTKDGTLLAWGKGAGGRLGLGSTTTRAYPTPVTAASLHQISICLVACGQQHSAALASDGSLYTFGVGRGGQLGHGHLRDQYRPKRVVALDGVHVKGVACGANHTAAYADQGQLYTWGWGENGRLGLGHEDTCTVPTLVGGSLEGMPVTGVACGSAHTLVIASHEAVYGFGWNEYNQVRKKPNQAPTPSNAGSSSDAHVLHPVRILDMVADDEGDDDGSQCTARSQRSWGQAGRIIKVSAGFGHSAVLTSDGRLFLWGFNGEGQLATGEETDRGLPVEVELLPEDQDVCDVALGHCHTVALVSEATAYGRNQSCAAEEAEDTAARRVQRFWRRSRLSANVRRRINAAIVHDNHESEAGPQGYGHGGHNSVGWSARWAGDGALDHMAEKTHVFAAKPDQALGLVNLTDEEAPFGRWQEIYNALVVPTRDDAIVELGSTVPSVIDECEESVSSANNRLGGRSHEAEHDDGYEEDFAVEEDETSTASSERDTPTHPAAAGSHVDDGEVDHEVDRQQQECTKDLRDSEVEDSSESLPALEPPTAAMMISVTLVTETCAASSPVTAVEGSTASMDTMRAYVISEPDALAEETDHIGAASTRDGQTTLSVDGQAPITTVESQTSVTPSCRPVGAACDSTDESAPTAGGVQVCAPRHADANRGGKPKRSLSKPMPNAAVTLPTPAGDAGSQQADTDAHRHAGAKKPTRPLPVWGQNCPNDQAQARSLQRRLRASGDLRHKHRPVKAVEPPTDIEPAAAAMKQEDAAPCPLLKQEEDRTIADNEDSQTSGENGAVNKKVPKPAANARKRTSGSAAAQKSRDQYAYFKEKYVAVQNQEVAASEANGARRGRRNAVDLGTVSKPSSKAVDGASEDLDTIFSCKDDDGLMNIEKEREMDPDGRRRSIDKLHQRLDALTAPRQVPAGRKRGQIALEILKDLDGVLDGGDSGTRHHHRRSASSSSTGTIIVMSPRQDQHDDSRTVRLPALIKPNKARGRR